MPRLPLAAAIALTLPAAHADAQGSREPCSYRWEDCVRREEIAREARDRALERASQAEALARRLTESGESRRAEQRIRAEDVPGIRSLRPRRPEYIYRERDGLHEQVMRALEREERMREQRYARARASQERARAMQERARERAFERAIEQREAAERRREAARARASRVRWQS
ncbi:MAG TPA: hypothetical protein VFO55_05460 [Gemmatimonadaceae bacterium]|nr:hypothetical protein [Gemmatimonadaceae bacterium]